MILGALKRESAPFFPIDRSKRLQSWVQTTPMLRYTVPWYTRNDNNIIEMASRRGKPPSYRSLSTPDSHVDPEHVHVHVQGPAPGSQARGSRQVATRRPSCRYTLRSRSESRFQGFSSIGCGNGSELVSHMVSVTPCHPIPMIQPLGGLHMIGRFPSFLLVHTDLFCKI